MSRREDLSVGELTLAGSGALSGAIVRLRDEAGNALLVTGTSVPSAVAGYAKGCLFIKTDAATGVRGLYENIGVTSSCNFELIDSLAPSQIALVNTHVLVGNASGVAADVAMSGDATMANTGAITIASGAVTRAKMSTAAGNSHLGANPATIATTGTTSVYILAAETGTVASVDFSGVDALAASDTNYITFAITNLGQNGAGSTAVLDTSALNTTKVTGGSALSANTKRSLTLNGTPANLNVTAGDRLKIDAVATGTLANTVTYPSFVIRFSGTT